LNVGPYINGPGANLKWRFAFRLHGLLGFRSLAPLVCGCKNEGLLALLFWRIAQCKWDLASSEKTAASRLFIFTRSLEVVRLFHCDVST
jgi:hypothetical protein